MQVIICQPTSCKPPIPEDESLAPVTEQMPNYEDVHLILEVVEGVAGFLRVVDDTLAAVILLGNVFSEALVDKLEQGSGVVWALKENVNEQQFIEYAAGECKPPKSRVRPQKWAVWHDRHSKGDPKK